MELSNYLLSQRTLLILPRFMRNEDYLPSLLEYLSEAGYEDEDIAIYPEIPLIINPFQRPTEVFLYEWVTHPKLLVNLLESKPLQIIHVKYINDFKVVTFGVNNVMMTNEMSDLYGALGSLSDEQKLIYGNHYFGLMPPSEIIESLNDNYMKIEYYGRGIEDKLDKPLSLLTESHVPHPYQDIKEHERHLELDSPKLTEVIKQFTIAPGKYVIVTDLRGLYGAYIIKKILDNVFQGKISVIDEHTPCDVVNDIIADFNQAQYGFLITCVVPHQPLIKVDNLIFFDHYNYNKIMGLVRIVNSEKVKVTLLVEMHPSLTTIASIKAKESIVALRKHEDTYQTLVNAAKPILIKDNELYVV